MISTEFQLKVNGEQRSLPDGATIRDLISQLSLNEKLVAVEVNRRLVKKATFSEHRLQPGDQVEIVEFVGGG